MAREQGTFKLDNPWPKIGWGTAVGMIVIAVVIGFGFLSRYQQNGPTLDLWSGICRGLGITSDIGPAAEPQPALRTPTRIAWTQTTLDQIGAGNAEHGAFIALNCTACHGHGGRSTSTLIPTLAGMDAAVTYKQLDDTTAPVSAFGASWGRWRRHCPLRTQPTPPPILPRSRTDYPRSAAVVCPSGAAA
jgi:hypothetical protein